MFRPESDKTIVRAKIAYVREAMDDHGYVSMNPFIQGYSWQVLSKVFSTFADDVGSAARFLSDQTKTTMFNKQEADIKGYMYARGFVIAGRNGKNPELMLCGVFQDRVYKTFTALRKLEELELTQGGFDTISTKNAMKALTSTYIMAKAIPIALGNDRQASPMLAAA